MQVHTSWLSEAEKRAIVDEAVELLGRVGMRYAGSAVLPLLEERGAQVDHATGIARLPRELVEWAAGQCPRSILMAGLTEADDVLLGEGEPFHFVPSGCVAKTLDFRTGERRASMLQDLRECTALMDELPQLDIMWTQVSASDVPLEQRELTEYFTMLTETPKHVTFVDCPGEVDAVLRICEALSGDLERFRARPRISTVVTAASPLQVDGGALDIHVGLAKHGVPIEVYSMTIAGATSPVTLAGTVTQGVAEFLGIATALQVAAPGARAVFCFGSGVLDMLRTTFALGSLESGLMGAMATEVGHYLGVPTLNPGLSTDAKHAGVQAGYEKAMKAATVCGAVPGHGLRLGAHRLAQHHVPAAIGDRQRDGGDAAPPHRPVEVSQATLSGEGRRRGGPGGSFLGLKDTAKRIRAGEHYMPTLSNRLSYEKWVEEASRSTTTRAPRWSSAGRARGQGAVLDGAQFDEIAAICRADDETVRRARRD